MKRLCTKLNTKRSSFCTLHKEVSIHGRFVMAMEGNVLIKKLHYDNMKSEDEKTETKYLVIMIKFFLA